MSFDRGKLHDELIRDEGMKLKPYRDTMGYLTIGVGHLIQSGEKFSELTPYAAMELLDDDIDVAIRRLNNIYPQWQELDDVRQRTLINLTFNLGYKLGDFRRFLHAAKSGDWDKAADALIQSRWYKQVRLRGPRIVHAIRTGTEWEGA